MLVLYNIESAAWIEDQMIIFMGFNCMIKITDNRSGGIYYFYFWKKYIWDRRLFKKKKKTHVASKDCVLK